MSAKQFRFSEFELDVSKRQLLRDGEPVSLSPKTLDLLVVLIESRGEVLTKDMLLEKVWPDQFIEEGNLKVHVSALRKAFHQVGNDHRFIVTVPGRGYSFVADLEDYSNDEVVVETHQYSTIVTEQSESVEDSGINNREPALIIRPARTQRRAVIISLSILIIAAGFVFWFFPRSTPVSPVLIETIAVMPFVNENGNADVDYLSDGMTETLINSLSQLPSLSVKARSSAFRYKNKAAAAKQIGSDLNVQAVLFGRFIQRGDDLTLFLSLVDTRSETQIWGKQYSRKLDNLLALQSEIARDVSESLRSKLSGADKQKFSRSPTGNVEAYNLYLQGRFHWNKFTGDGIRTAIKYFEQAIEKDKNYALAYTGLASSYIVLGVNGHMPVTEARPLARAAAETAIVLDDSLAEAHLVLGANKFFFDWDLYGAESEFKTSMELDPGFAHPHQLYSYVLRSQSRFEEALAEAEKAHELDPLDLLVYDDVAAGYRIAGRWGDAVETDKKIIEMDPNFADVRVENGYANSLLGNHDIALAEMNHALSLSNNNDTHIKASIGILHARAGRKADAQKVIDELLADSGQHNVSPLDIALVYSVLNDRDKAFEWLNKAVAERTPWLIELNVNPELAPIRDDPRFQEILQKVNSNN
ncbi:MAG TPA: winged helix-turn-helix domain-containing protein [Pyrinomonadaceae bacterium]|nr:winged helix-turn-helix domain-containing protein [Pyrinomonadaceae bacterium]